MILNKKHINTTDRLTEKEYRSLKSIISYSDLKLLDNDREKFFKEKILLEKKVDKKSASLIMGDMVHGILSGSESWFDEKFVLTQTVKPTAQMATLCDNLYTRTLKSISVNEVGDQVQQDTFDTIFTDALQYTQYNAKGEQVAFKGKTKEKVLEMFQEKGELYYKECIENIGRSIVSTYEIERAEKLADGVRKHPFTAEYTTTTSTEEMTIYNELPILFSKEGVEYRSMPDVIRIIHSEKKVQSIDWKTTWDAEDGVIGSYLKHGYYLQAAMYQDAIRYWCDKNGMKDYTVEPMLFIFCDTGGWADPCKFQLKQDDVDRGHRGLMYRGRRYKGLDTIKKDLEWHLETGIWTSDREIYQNNGYLKNPIRYGSI